LFQISPGQNRPFLSILGSLNPSANIIIKFRGKDIFQREGYLYGGIEPCEFAGPEIAGERAMLER